VRPPQEIALGDYPGIEAEFLTEAGSLQVSRCYLMGDRAYLLTATNELFSPGAGLQPMTWSSSVPVRSPAMDKFFNSFEILP